MTSQDIAGPFQHFLPRYIKKLYARDFPGKVMEIEKMKVQKGVHPENREVHFRAPVALERGRAVRSYNRSTRTLVYVCCTAAPLHICGDKTGQPTYPRTDMRLQRHTWFEMTFKYVGRHTHTHTHIHTHTRTREILATSRFNTGDYAQLHCNPN